MSQPRAMVAKLHIMPTNPSEADRGGPEPRGESAGEQATDPGVAGPRNQTPVNHEAETETLALAKPEPEADKDDSNLDALRERRFTAPGFDEKETQVIATAPEAATEVFQTQTPPPNASPPPRQIPPKTAVPQSIPPRSGGKKPASEHRNWGWVLAIVVIVLALAAIAILGTLLFTRTQQSQPSQEDRVRSAIQGYDVAIQTGDLKTLRSTTCGAERDSYAEYDEKDWAETYRRVSTARQYPVIASIDQVIVHGEQAEANVTAYMAHDPQVRSTRSLDLQFRDDQWKVCQSPSS